MEVKIPIPQRINNKVQGEFYPLQKQELIALRKAKLINNTAFIHLALRYENPFCDRPVEIIPKEFALRWAIPESSIYKAIAQLKKQGLILIKSGRLLIEWITKSDQQLSDPAKIIGSETEFSDPAKDSQIRQKLSDPAKDSQIRQTIIRSGKINSQNHWKITSLALFRLTRQIRPFILLRLRRKEKYKKLQM